MSRCIYDKFSITLSDDTFRYICDTVRNITEYDHEIEFETIAPDRICRICQVMQNGEAKNTNITNINQ